MVAADRSKAVVLVMLIFLYPFVVFTTSSFILSRALFLLMYFLAFLSIMITTLGEKKAGLYASRALVVYFVCVTLCNFALFIDVMGGPRLVTVTHKSTVAHTVMCRQGGRGRFPVLLDDLFKCRTNSHRT